MTTLKGRIEAILLKHCPKEIAENARASSWAAGVCQALIDHHGEDGKAISRHSMLIASAIRSHGERLSRIPPSSLVRMNPKELNEQTVVSSSWSHSIVSHAPILDEHSAWRIAGSKCELVLVSFCDALLLRALHTAFVDIERVHIVDGNILNQDGGEHMVDAFVSPANTTGNMDGGIDRVYADHFGWSYGRPYQEVNPLQEVIDRTYGVFKPLPVGSAALVPVIPLTTQSNSSGTTSAAAEGAHNREGNGQRTVKWLIAAPTMERPGPIEVGSRIVYAACLAAFRVWKEAHVAHGVKRVAMPGFGTGFGMVPAEVAARQMHEAFVAVWGAP